MRRYIKKRLTVIGIIASIGLLLWFVPTTAANAKDAIGGEKRSTLSPELFKDKTAYTYQIAKEIPEVLDNIYCYCHCQKHAGHKSLLSCYTDKHAAFCDVCQNEAIMAYELYKEGKDIKTIKKMVDEEFGR